MAMAGGHFGAALRRIERLFASGTVAGLSEGQLIERFATSRDEAAFEAILARHGPMVLGICRQVLRDPNDVEDAFQATFLILVRKAGTLRDRDLVGNWLFGVASRVALRSRAAAARRRAVEGANPAIEAVAEPEPESRPWLHEEVRRLPDKYRVPVVLCYLEGLTHEEAARQLRWPVGTVKGRLARARELLLRRLTRRGMALSSATLAASLARDAGAVVPALLVESTSRAAASVAAGQALAAALVAANVAALVEGVLKTMFLNKLKFVVTVLVAGILATGAAVRAFQDEARPGPGRAARPAPRTAPSAGTRLPAKAAEKHYEDGARVEIMTLARSVAARDRSPRNRAILTKLEEPVVMSFANETPLQDVLKYIQAATQGPNDSGIPIYLDPLALKELHIDPMTAPISIDVEGVPLKTTLRLVLKQLKLAHCVKDGMLIISSVDGILQELREVEAADEADEASSPGGAAGPGPAPLRTVTAGPAPVGSVGARPKAEAERVPVAPPTVAPPSEGPSPPDNSSDPGTLKSEAIGKRLGEPVKLSVSRETPLSDVLKSLKEATRAADGGEIPIYVDPAVSDQLKQPVEFDLEGIPLRTTLSLLLSRLGLRWGVQDGLLIISTENRLEDYRRIAYRFTFFPKLEDGLNPDQERRRSEILAKFAAPISLSFPDPTPLGEVLKTIRDAGIPVFFGPPVRVVEPQVVVHLQPIETLPVRIDVKEVPLRTCLALLLASQESFKSLGRGMNGSPPSLEGLLLDGLLVIGTGDWVNSLVVPRGGAPGGLGTGMGGMGGQGMR